MNKNTPLKKTEEKVQASLNRINEKIAELGQNTEVLSNTLNDIQRQFNKIRRFPKEQKLKCEAAITLQNLWKLQADKIVRDYESAQKKNLGGGVAGVGIGVAVVALGPSVAMGIATTFGVASTGTAISALSGAAATNAALAWLGGGALAAGGGGMAAGHALLALAGPIGWSIAGVAILASGITIFVNIQDRKLLDNIFIRIYKRDLKSYELALIEINERISRISNEREKIVNAIDNLKSYGYEYLSMSDEQKYALGTYVNLVSSATLLLTDPIQSIQPKYTEEDYDRYLSIMYQEGCTDEYIYNKKIIVYLSWALYFHLLVFRKVAPMVAKAKPLPD